MEINYIFEKLFNYFNVSTIRELSEKINISESTISKWKQRNSINAIKKKCRELGIYNQIFGDSYISFSQNGANSTQIKTQNNKKDVFNSSSINKNININIDDEFLPLFQALSSVAIALNKKEQLKEKLKDLISKLPIS
ncbi:helix-turn-helix domain-containing protein [Aliarcobacter skirrowii]|uniref:Helix-turn-helix transcriptional regulator n=1 Tax=Aliarcobacter skirrowii TaxID=28200 RepID=A0AAW9DC88_9BACT|nr:helix-turn-helix transcriptional regulator [Aliarcobacter skirrowii]MDX4069824.1 helix-turn-helix transcriptional regulator [Aliarcobacter skirrowii]